MTGVQTCALPISENIKAGFLKGEDVFGAQGVRYLAPLVNLDEPPLAARQLHESLRTVLPDLTAAETRRAVDAGLAALEGFSSELRSRSRAILAQCAREEKPCILVVARPYHMDPGIGHEIEVDLQGYGYPVLWSQYLPTDPGPPDWKFGTDLVGGSIDDPLGTSPQ